MPAPLLATLANFRALWKESKPLRTWLWGKMPIVKDVKKREIVEGHLAKLLDDANKLAQAVPAGDLDDKIAELVSQFRKEIVREGITGEEANALVERANLLARLYITGPLGDVIDLRFRLGEDEEALRAAERAIESLQSHTSTLETHVHRLEVLNHRLTMIVAASGTAAVLGLLVALAALAAHR